MVAALVAAPTAAVAALISDGSTSSASAASLVGCARASAAASTNSAGNRDHNVQLSNNGVETKTAARTRSRRKIRPRRGSESARLPRRLEISTVASARTTYVAPTKTALLVVEYTVTSTAT